MPELSRLDFAKMQIENVREWLLNAAAFGKSLSPETMEIMAGKLAEGLRIYTDATQDQK
ncbi:MULTISPECIES: DUF6374 family protein [Nocardia]|uniref:DUF6374 family protein n=1 Tax=Nocardia sp. NPDC047648 TaxID=3155625 RepID=UPI0034029499